MNKNIGIHKSKENIEMKKSKPKIFWQRKIEEIGRDYER
jgi:hypothetical protein